MSNNREQDAREQAYQEYLKLRDANSGRGHYIKDDTKYGSYFSNNSTDRSSSGNDYSIDDTPYGSSEMRRHSKDAQREEYLDMREHSSGSQSEKKKKGSRIAEPGSVNKADGKQDGGPKKKKKKKKSGRGLRIALIVTLVLVIGIGGVIVAGLTAVKSTLDNVGRVELDPDLIGIDPQVDSDLRNYRNIAILGIDARDMSSDKGCRSDAMVIVSINKETNEIKMFSVYRDTYLDLGDDVGLDKVTHAYYYGGPTKALYTLNKNLDLNIKEVVVVNWKSVADAVDALGGLDIEVQESEINEMNKYISDTYHNIGGSNKKIKSAGMQTLNGNQAVTYARIRKDAVTGDYRRNERMKIVVKAAFDKAKTMNVSTINKISNEILPEIKTNMASSDMMKLALKLDSYKMTESKGWPYDTRDWNAGTFYGVPSTLSSNVTKLHADFFGQKDYTPTQTVQGISEQISARTGYY